MKKYDFVFVWEVKNRELENDCLIAYELERRGYKVGFIGTWDEQFKRSKPLKTEVVIAFALYDDALIKFIDHHVIECDKYLNMQWEQVFTNITAKLDKKSVLKHGGAKSIGVSEKAVNAVHLCWGENSQKRLINQYEVEENNLPITGHVTLDFLRPELRGYYLSREELFQRYKIPVEKRVCLFISSFSYTNMPESVSKAENNTSLGFDIDQMCKLTIDSQKGILSWIERVLSDDEDLVFIYRPHPSENDNKVLMNMTKRFPNFYVINEMSVKQWIVAADDVYTWESTSIAEVYAVEKACGVLRPVEIPYELEMEVYNNATVISSYKEFKESLDQEMLLPIAKEKMKKYYFVDKQCPTYMKICDLLEDIYKQEKYCLGIEHTRRTEKTRIRYNIYMLWSRLLIQKNTTRKILKKMYPNKFIDLDTYLYYKKMYKNNHATRKEIRSIINRIRYVLEKQS